MNPLLPGLPPGVVFLSEPAPEWAGLFEAEAHRLRAALGPAVIAIEHYGSTAIPGIKAKPVIDLLVGTPRLDDALACVAVMQELGYDHAPNAGVPDHHVFGKGVARTHLAHFVEWGGRSWTRCLTFRDRLRADPRLAAEYEGLKISLAERNPTQRGAYTEGKTAFVEAVLAG